MGLMRDETQRGKPDVDQSLFWINEGYFLTDAGHVITTSYVDLRNPEDRTPVTGLVRGCERNFALEDCETIMISNPARFRSYGEELILDVQEGLAKEETVEISRETAAEVSRRRAVSDLNQALELTDSSMRPTFSTSHSNTKKHRESIRYAKEWWILSTSITPDDDGWEIWRSNLPRNYDHVSEIGQPAKFAQALAHMVVEQIGPRGQECSLRSAVNDAEMEKTAHKSQWVIHGPVVYVDSVHDTLDAIKEPASRIAASIFTKGKDHAPLREYRFAVMNEGAKAETVLLQISGMMKDALKPNHQKLVRIPPVTISTGTKAENMRPDAPNESLTLVAKQGTSTERSVEREEWRFETRGSDGQVLDSEGGTRESVSERTVKQNKQLNGNHLQTPTDFNDGSNDGDAPLPTPDSANEAIDPNQIESDEEAAKELALDEFDWDNRESDGDSVAIPIRTVTGRVYKSFEEIMNDPSYPLSPMGKVWQEDANTPEEIIKTYRAIDVVDLKMKDVKSEFRQDLASAGWYAMMCIRNVYGRLGDIVDTVSIENQRFIVIRLKDTRLGHAKGRIVIAPSGVYAYCLQLPNEEMVGHGGEEWGTKFFPFGGDVETFESYGWTKNGT